MIDIYFMGNKAHTVSDVVTASEVTGVSTPKVREAVSLGYVFSGYKFVENNNYPILSRENYLFLWEKIRYVGHMSKLLMLWLSLYGDITISQEDIAKELGVCIKSVATATRECVGRGLIKISGKPMCTRYTSLIKFS